MKKLVTFALFLAVALTLYAKDGDQITLEAGTANVIWTLPSAYFQTDFSEVTVEGKPWNQWLKDHGDDYVRDWPQDKLNFEGYFMTRFNKKTKKKRGMNLQNTNPNDAYRMIIHLKEVDMGSIGGGVTARVFLGAFASKAGGITLENGYIDILENKTNKVVCRLSYKKVKGDGGLSMSSQFVLVFEDLHDEVIGFAERFKDKQMPETYASKVDYETPNTQIAEPQVAVESQSPATQREQLEAQATPKKESGKSSKTKAVPATKVQSKPTAKSSAKSELQPATQPQAPVSASGSQMVSVKLKTGTTINGVMKSFDPLDKIVVVIAGQETTIPMSKVEKVEMADSTPTPVQQVNTSSPVVSSGSNASSSVVSSNSSLGNQKLLATDNGNYSERISITIGNTPVEMILVRGGRMNMGYDGSGSLKMHSEPVHEVEVTSFYISTQPLSASLVNQFVNSKNIDGKGGEPAEMRMYEDVEKLITSIASQSGRPLRLPTEAEWEYAACSDNQNTIFSIASGNRTAYEWCSDFLDDYPEDGAVLTDPTGPLRGKERVIRAFNNKRGKFDRSNKIDEDEAYLGLVRLVLKAKDIR
jgi:formylglycine-generating enzyme required for sulfatase activity